MTWGWVTFIFGTFTSSSHIFLIVLSAFVWNRMFSNSFLMQKGFWVTDSWVPTLKIQWKWSTVWASWPRNSLAWYFQYTMVCGVLITSHVLSRIDIMQIACSAASCCCSSFVISHLRIGKVPYLQQKAQMLHFFQHFGKHLCQQPWLFPACVWCKLCLMCVTSCFPLRKRINDAAFPFLVKGDERITDRWALESRWISTYQ